MGDAGTASAVAAFTRRFRRALRAGGSGDNEGMNPESTRLLVDLLRRRRVAALATLHDGHPAASAVPFALADDARSVVVHVSGLAAHTRQMLEHPQVALVVMAEDDGSLMAQALPRVGLQGVARAVEADSAEHERARAVYLAKFPQAAELFEFSDFQVFVIDVVEARLVAGFARAHTLWPDDLQRHAGVVPSR